MKQLVFLPAVVPLFIAAGLTIILAVYAWRHRIAKGGRAAFWLLTAIAAWSVFSAFQLMSRDPQASAFFHKLKYLGVIGVPSVFLVFALDYTSPQEHGLSRRHLWLALVPLITLVLIWTNDFHDLFWKYETILMDGMPLRLKRSYGIWFWVHTAYSYAVLLIGTVLLVRETIRSSWPYHRQTLIIIAGTAVPWIGNVMYLFHLGPWPDLDLTPLAFAWTGLVIIGGLFRFRFLDLVPVARNAVIQGMSDGLFVLDLQDRIVDMNLAAEKIIAHSVKLSIGAWIGRFLPSLVELLDSYRKLEQSQLEIPLDRMIDQTYFDVKITPLRDRRGRLLGRLVVLRDITQRKQAEEKLYILAITDPLTGLFNRRHFFSLAEKYFQQAKRTQQTLSALMIDIDYFKSINDSLGHTVGDQVLIEMAELLVSPRTLYGQINRLNSHID